MAKKHVSEKSLELNICAEMLREIRHRYPRASWLGLTQRQEREHGFDERIHNAPGFLMIFQMKAPHVGKRDRFTISRRQHDALNKLLVEDVYYVFPRYNRWKQIDSCAPDLLQDTWLVPVKCISYRKGRTQKTYSIDVERVGSAVNVTGPSLSVSCVPSNAASHLSEIERMPTTTVDVAEDNPSQAQIAALTGSRLTGLNALYVPP